jgi:uncharacterized protein (TIGR03083 family)
MASKVSGGVCRRGGCSGPARQETASLGHVAGDGSDSWMSRGQEATAALAETWESLVAVCWGLDAAGWDVATDCPGWTVKDQLSHLIGIERTLIGEAPPEWDAPLGEHVRNPFAEENEKWIAARRSHAGLAVLAEFMAVTELRLATLRGLTGDEWAHVGPTIVGEVAYADFMRTRVFDSWVHEQDVRRALGRPGGTGGLASAFGMAQVEGAMGFVVGKKAAAPDGAVVRFSLTGPATDARHITLAVEGGRARPAGPGVAPTVNLALSSLDFVRLGCGRVAGGELEAAGGVVVEGDAALGQKILEAMNFMF